MEFDAWSRIKSIWPATRSFKAGPVPRYGTIVKARAGDLLEINLCDLRGRACARGTCRSLGFVRLQPSDEFLEICRRHVLLGHDQLRIGRKQCDRREILQQVVAQIVDRAVDDMCAPMADTDCITVRRRVCDAANTDRTRGTAPARAIRTGVGMDSHAPAVYVRALSLQWYYVRRRRRWSFCEFQCARYGAPHAS